MVYYNLMTVGQAWVGAGQVGMLPTFMLALHGGTLALGLLLVTARPQPLVAARPAATRGCMRTIRRFIYREVVVSVAFVTWPFWRCFLLRPGG